MLKRETIRVHMSRLGALVELEQLVDQRTRAVAKPRRVQHGRRCLQRRVVTRHKHLQDCICAEPKAPLGWRRDFQPHRRVASVVAVYRLQRLKLLRRRGRIVFRHVRRCAGKEREQTPEECVNARRFFLIERTRAA